MMAVQSKTRGGAGIAGRVPVLMHHHTRHIRIRRNATIDGRPLDLDSPLWEMHVVEGLESGHVAVVPKVHHALFDGASGG